MKKKTSFASKRPVLGFYSLESISLNFFFSFSHMLGVNSTMGSDEAEKEASH